MVQRAMNGVTVIELNIAKGGELSTIHWQANVIHNIFDVSEDTFGVVGFGYDESCPYSYPLTSCLYPS